MTVSGRMTFVVLSDDDNPGLAGPREVVGERAYGPADLGLLVPELLLAFYLLALVTSDEQHALVVHVSPDLGLLAHRGTAETTLGRSQRPASFKRVPAWRRRHTPECRRFRAPDPCSGAAIERQAAMRLT